MTINRNKRHQTKGQGQSWWLLVHSYDVNGPIKRNEHFWSEITSSWVKIPKEASLYKSREEALLQAGRLAQKYILAKAVRADRLENPITPMTVVIDHESRDSHPMTVTSSSPSDVILVRPTAEESQTLTLPLDRFLESIRHDIFEVIWDPDSLTSPNDNADYLRSIGFLEED